MAQSQRKLAKKIGVSQSTIRNAKKSLGIKNSKLTKDDVKKIAKKVKPTKKLKEEQEKKLKVNNKSFKPKVRRIDKNEKSSVEAMLQDTKERYVQNEILIQRIENEINQQDKLMVGNNNGTISAIPQLSVLEKFQKINISLRNQIVDLEKVLEKIAEPKKEDNPFE